jgi:hypothetical protein
VIAGRVLERERAAQAERERLAREQALSEEQARETAARCASRRAMPSRASCGARSGPG